MKGLKMATITQNPLPHPILHSAVRFALVGLLGTLVDFALFGTLHLAAGLPALPANTLSYSAGIVNNYVFHSRWTFRMRQKNSSAKQFVRFLFASLCALLLNNLVVLLLAPFLHTLLNDASFNSLLAKLCAVGVGMIWNFCASHLWIFQADSRSLA
jgi:putative flippase GtrA